MTRYWASRTATKSGGVLPHRPRSRTFPASTAMRRHEHAIDDRVAARDYVQLAPGVLVVWERQPWRVLEVEERPLDLWGEKYEQWFANEVASWERWQRGDKPEKATWRSRPFMVQIVPAADPKTKPLHLRTPASYTWTVLPEHYAICVACGELPPCRHELAEREADERAAHADVLMDIPPGHCLGCGEFVTARQTAARFPGPNLWRPDLPDNSAVFHGRQECSHAVFRYRQQWEAQRETEQPQRQLTFNDDA